MLGHDGTPLRSILLLTRRSLVVLLPEGGAAAAHYVALRVRLQLYRTMEELLLPTPQPAPTADDAAAPEPVPLHTWGAAAAYDGGDAWVLPPGAHALASGGHAIDPAPLRAAADAVATARQTAGGSNADAQGNAAAAGLVRALAEVGFRPEVLLTSAGAEDAYSAGSGALVALLHASGNVDSAAAVGAASEAPAASLEAAALAACTDGLALRPGVLHAVLGHGSAGGGAAAAAAAGAAAHTRQLQAALQEGYGWSWCELAADDAGKLPPGLAATLRERLRAPHAPLPPEPLDDSLAEAPAWFYGQEVSSNM